MNFESSNSAGMRREKNPQEFCDLLHRREMMQKNFFKIPLSGISYEPPLYPSCISSGGSPGRVVISCYPFT
jgi:hypothetical protein